MGAVEERAEESAEHVGAHDKEAYVGAALGRAHRHEGGVKSPFRRHKEEARQRELAQLRKDMNNIAYMTAAARQRGDTATVERMRKIGAEASRRYKSLGGT